VALAEALGFSSAIFGLNQPSSGSVNAPIHRINDFAGNESYRVGNKIDKLFGVPRRFGLSRQFLRNPVIGIFTIFVRVCQDVCASESMVRFFSQVEMKILVIS